MLQCDLNRQSEWACAWQMQYNMGKCEIINFNRNNRTTDYYLNGYKLRGEYSTRASYPRVLALKESTAGTAGGKAGNWYADLHNDRI